MKFIDIIVICGQIPYDSLILKKIDSDVQAIVFLGSNTRNNFNRRISNLTTSLGDGWIYNQVSGVMPHFIRQNSLIIDDIMQILLYYYSRQLHGNDSVSTEDSYTMRKSYPVHSHV